jgi:BRCA1-associated protein
MMAAHQHLYSLIIAVHPEHENGPGRGVDTAADRSVDWRLGEISVDWVDFTREKSVDRPASSLASASMEGTSTLHEHGSGARAGAASKPGSGSRRKVVGSTPTPSRLVPGSSTTATSVISERHTSNSNSNSHPHSHSTPTTRKKSKSPSDATSSPDSLSLQPLLAHFPGPNPLESSVASGVTQVGRGVVHLFRHAPPPALISSLEAHPLGESSAARHTAEPDPWSGERAEGEDGSLIAILAVPAWMRPADFLEFIGGWSTGLEGVRMIR